MKTPAIGEKFKVSFPKKDKESFHGVITKIDNDPANSDRQYHIQQSNRIAYDAINKPYSRPDSTIEVERNWFDFELTGRKIELI